MASNLIALVITPMISLVNLVVAAIFATIGSCCSDPDVQEEWYQSARDNARLALAFFALGEIVIFARIFNINAGVGFETIIQKILDSRNSSRALSGLDL
jgi:hypothetical protein